MQRSKFTKNQELVGGTSRSNPNQEIDTPFLGLGLLRSFASTFGDRRFSNNGIVNSFTGRNDRLSHDGVIR
ncbi:hypothetical protein HCU40_14740 [Pseudanabaena biceps]|nr:hypothetical protein [Pseudanabaena biceps]